MDPAEGSSQKSDAAKAVPEDPAAEPVRLTYEEDYAQHLLVAQEDQEKTRKRSRSKKPKDMPRRPLSAYNIFFKEQRANLQGEPKGRKKSKFGFEELGKKIGALWKQLGPEEKKIYQDQAKIEMERYQKEMEQYQTNVKKKARLETEGPRFSSGSSDMPKQTAVIPVLKSTVQDTQETGISPLADAFATGDRRNPAGNLSFPGMGLASQQMYVLATQQTDTSQQYTLPEQGLQFTREGLPYLQQFGDNGTLQDNGDEYSPVAFPHPIHKLRRTLTCCSTLRASTVCMLRSLNISPIQCMDWT